MGDVPPRARALAVAAALARAAAVVAWRAAAARAHGRRPPVAALAGQALADTLVRLGPTWVKAGQILATRQDLLPPTITGPLQRLFEDVPPGPAEWVEQVFRTELGAAPDDAFAAWDPAPVASASVASVYRAWLPDGSPVAVKVLRPGIADLVQADLAMLRRAAAVVERLPRMGAVPLRAMVGELAACLEAQLDLRREAAANRRLRAALTYEEGVVIPPLHDELCSESILTMAWVGRADGIDSGRSLLTVLGALYRMIFVEGFVHCDLHPGNLRLLPGGAALLDFGFMAELDEADRLAFAQFFYAMAAGDGPACAEIALDTAAACPAGIDRVAFEAEMTAIVDDVAGATASEFSVAGFVTRLFDLMRRHRVRGTTAFTMAIVSLLVLEGLAKDAGVDLDFQNEARPYLFRASLMAAPRERVTSERVDELVREQLVNVPVATAVDDASAAA